jgi:hypothetical protein
LEVSRRCEWKFTLGRFAPHNNICEGCSGRFFFKDQQLEGETCQLTYHGLRQSIWKGVVLGEWSGPARAVLN